MLVMVHDISNGLWPCGVILFCQRCVSQQDARTKFYHASLSKETLKRKEGMVSRIQYWYTYLQQNWQVRFSMKSQDIISISQSCKNYLEQQLEERKKWKVFWLRSCCKIKNLQVSKFNSFSPLRAWLCAPPAPPAADWELRAWEVERWRGGPNVNVI